MIRTHGREDGLHGNSLLVRGHRLRGGRDTVGSQSSTMSIGLALSPSATCHARGDVDVPPAPWLCAPASRRVCPFERCGGRGDPRPQSNPSPGHAPGFGLVVGSHRSVATSRRGAGSRPGRALPHGGSDRPGSSSTVPRTSTQGKHAVGFSIRFTRRRAPATVADIHDSTIATVRQANPGLNLADFFGNAPAGFFREGLALRIVGRVSA
jgi:hypothetical protein